MKFIRLFVNNPVAANMLMILILGGGLAASFLIPREMFPEFELDMISITVPYPGATPDDIERGICLKIEDYVENIEGVDEVTSISREGVGTVTLELEEGADTRKVLDNVKSEIDNLRDKLPANAEEPVVRELTIKRHVIQVAVFGPATERTLKELAEEVKDDLTALPEISQVEVSGVREYEISVEIDEEMLRRLNLTMADVAWAIRGNSFDLPAGRIKTERMDYSLRIVGQKYTAREYETVPVLTQDDGTIIRLRDIAEVRESFEDVDTGGQFNGQPAAMVSVYKIGDEDVVKIAKAVHEYIRQKNPTLPEGIQLGAWSDLSRMVSDRLEMLVRNGLQGLVLVVLVLWLFLGLRLSIWVALGIPISVLGAIIVMNLTGQTLNMMSMFALIMGLGLIVDDAIVVGENIYSKFQDGQIPRDAAVLGAEQVEFPVLGAVMTTWLAFIPLFLIPGTMGKFIGQLPQVIIVALGFSLLECLTILPSHLAHSLERQRKLDVQLDQPGWYPAWRRGLRHIRNRIDGGIQFFIDRAFLPTYRVATSFRYVTIALAVFVLLAMLGAMKGGLIKQTIFPKIESDTLKATLTLPTGTPMELTETLAQRITDAAMRLNNITEAESGQPMVKQVYTLLGQTTGRRGGGDSGGHLAQVVVELLPTEQRGRDWSSQRITNLWREQTGPIPQALSVTFGAFRGGPGGVPLEFRVLAPNTEIANEIAEDLQDVLRNFAGVSDVQDDALPGKMEIRIQPKPKAYFLGLDQRMLADQLRDAFYGNESIEIQRGRDEIEVMVRYPEQQRRSLRDLEDKRIRTPDGGEVPFSLVAETELQRGYTTLRRVTGKSVVTVTADVDEDVANAEAILRDLQDSGTLRDLTAGHPGAEIDLRGQRQQRSESLGALLVWFPMALLGIYTILAAIFRSYLQPLIVMVAIPFGLIGAVIGHWIMGFDITLLSMFGMVALAGIVVNDSLVLLDLVNLHVRDGKSVFEAARLGARNRFRAILLTTITTVAGMAPLLAERSFQAQFLKPMAVSITFGLSFATILTLVIVPCLYLIGNDLRRVGRWLWHGE